MAKNKAEFDDLLQIDARPALQAALANWPDTLTLPQAQSLATHALALAPTAAPLRLAIVHTYTSDLLDPWLNLAAATAGWALQTYHAPYGLALQEAATGSALLAHQPDITLLMLRREDLDPALALPISGLAAEQRDALRRSCLAWVQDVVGRFRAQAVGHLLLTLLPSLAAPTLGLYDDQAAASSTLWWALLKRDIAEWIREACPATQWLDLDELAQQVGRAGFFDRRYWYSARYPFAAPAARELARRVVGIGTVLKTPRAKVLVLDADNTLWGGIIGEDGIDGIALGPDYPGNAFVDFQRRILDFQQRGLILALCSKNNAADVDQVLQSHPHQLLRDAHFAARRVNWLPKAENLKSLAEELNLGLESFIFVDDSDHECAAVRHQLPMVEVVQVPKRPTDIPTCLDAVSRLEILALTAEDLSKTTLYAQERRRREFTEQLGDGVDAAGGDYLSRLKMQMQLGVNPRAHLARLSQLSKKTNQFNLTTRRYDEQQMRGFIEADDWLVLDFSLADVFGDSGVVGLALWRLTAPGCAELDTFLMSCRVIGRQAESAFLHWQLRLLADRGVRQVMADYLPSAKNDLVRHFLPEQGFEARADGRYHLDLMLAPPRPPESFPITVSVLADTLPITATTITAATTTATTTTATIAE